MKVFEGDTSSYYSKVNFVDSNDVFVGYDTVQECCEDAGWFVAPDITPYDYDTERNGLCGHSVEDYIFDTNFFTEVESDSLDGGGQVAFRLIAEGKPDLYLHLFNSHNGYYGHGFEVKHSGTVVKEGVL
jgi:hypothetical protein